MEKTVCGVMDDLAGFLDDGVDKMTPYIRGIYESAVRAKVDALVNAAEQAADTNDMENYKMWLVKRVLNAKDAPELAKAIALEWIQFWGGEGSRWSDEHNEFAIQKCAQIAASSSFKAAASKYRRPEIDRAAIMFVEHSVSMHKAFMQQFTGILLCILAKIEPQMEGDIGDSDMPKI